MAQRELRITRHCEARGCSTATHGGKPYCPAHLFHNDYAANLHSVVNAVEAEVKRASKKPPPPVGVADFIALEIIRVLGDVGPRTMERLNRDISYATIDAIENYVSVLKDAGMVFTKKSARGSTLVSTQEYV